jgi:hypothetical protein
MTLQEFEPLADHLPITASEAVARDFIWFSLGVARKYETDNLHKATIISAQNTMADRFMPEGGGDVIDAQPDPTGDFPSHQRLRSIARVKSALNQAKQPNLRIRSDCCPSPFRLLSKQKRGRNVRKFI